MSKVETSIVTITKTVVRYTAAEYEEVMISDALKQSGVEMRGEPAAHVRVDGEDVVVELMLEQGQGQADDPEPFVFARPNIK